MFLVGYSWYLCNLAKGIVCIEVTKDQNDLIAERTQSGGEEDKMLQLYGPRKTVIKQLKKTCEDSRKGMFFFKIIKNKLTTGQESCQELENDPEALIVFNSWLKSPGSYV